MFWKWIKRFWKKLTGDQEKNRPIRSKTISLSDNSNLNRVNISGKSPVININSGGKGNTYNVNNLGRDVIINNASRRQSDKNYLGISSQTKKDATRKNYNMNDEKVSCDGCGILKEPFFLDEYSNGKRYCIRCR